MTLPPTLNVNFEATMVIETTNMFGAILGKMRYLRLLIWDNCTVGPCGMP
jgi:hypothetical protein